MQIGFKRWGNVRNPCWCCGSDRNSLFKFPTSYAENPWAPRDAEAYSLMVQNSTVRVQIAEKRVFKLLVRALALDSDAGGLALQSDFPLLGLRKGYRLLEEDSVTDIHKLGDVELPCALSFFSKDAGHGLNHICPLFGVAGFTIESLSLDCMHIIDLGIMQYVAGEILQKLIVKNFAGSTKRKVAMRRLDNLMELRRLDATAEHCHTTLLAPDTHIHFAQILIMPHWLVYYLGHLFRCASFLCGAIFLRNLSKARSCSGFAFAGSSMSIRNSCKD